MPRTMDEDLTAHIVAMRALDFNKQEIANEVDCTSKTVSNHLDSIYEEFEEYSLEPIKFVPKYFLNYHDIHDIQDIMGYNHNLDRYFNKEESCCELSEIGFDEIGFLESYIQELKDPSSVRDLKVLEEEYEITSELDSRTTVTNIDRYQKRGRDYT